jgi:hypothetical protein
LGGSLGCRGCIVGCGRFGAGDDGFQASGSLLQAEDTMKANKNGNLNGRFDIHIAIPKHYDEQKTRPVPLEQIRQDLRDLIPKFKYFLQVKNFDADEAKEYWTLKETAEKHDLADPGAMATIKIGNGNAQDGYKEARPLIKEAMKIIESHGVYHGNFELEHFMDENIRNLRGWSMPRDFPGYVRVMPPDAPSHENHVIYRGRLIELPTMDQIVQLYNEQMQVTPHQAVVFARSPNPKPDDLASLALTFYQKDRDSVLRFGRKLEEKADKLKCDDVITEQVVIVGERAH